MKLCYVVEFLSLMWSIRTRIMISLSSIWLKCIFYMCRDPFKTPYDVRKIKNITRDIDG